MQRVKSRPASTSRRIPAGRPPDGGGHPTIRLIRYRLHVSKSQTFPELLTEAIDDWYESDSDFARKAGVRSPSSVSRWKAGLSIPSVPMLKQIAPHLHTSAKTLIEMCYGTDVEAEAAPQVPRAVTHPLAKEIDKLLGNTSPLDDADKTRLTTVVDSAVDPYRGRRKRRSA